MTEPEDSRRPTLAATVEGIYAAARAAIAHPLGTLAPIADEGWSVVDALARRRATPVPRPHATPAPLGAPPHPSPAATRLHDGVRAITGGSFLQQPRYRHAAPPPRGPAPRLEEPEVHIEVDLRDWAAAPTGGGTARGFAARLALRAEAFRAGLGPDRELGVHVGPRGEPVYLDEVGYEGPDLVYLSGRTADGACVQHVQHLAHASVCFVALARRR